MSELIQRLRDDRDMTLRERTKALTKAAPDALVDLIEERRLNWLETPLLLVLSLSDEDDWELGAAGVNELGKILKRRSSELEEQLEWLRRKGLVEDNEDDAGLVSWQVSERVDQLLAGSPR